MKSKFFKQSRNETLKKDAIMKVSENEDGEYSSRQVLGLNNNASIKKMVIPEKQNQTIIQEQNIPSNNGNEVQQELSLQLYATPQLARPSNIADKEEIKFSSSGHDMADNKLSGEGQVLPKG